MPPTNSSRGTEDDEEASASFRLRMPQEGEPARCVGLAASQIYAMEADSLVKARMLRELPACIERRPSGRATRPVGKLDCSPRVMWRRKRIASRLKTDDRQVMLWAKNR